MMLRKAKDAIAKRIHTTPVWALVLGGTATSLLVFKWLGGGQMVGGAFDWAKSEIFKASLTKAASQYGDVILQVAQETGMDPTLIFAIGDRESGWGVYLTPKDSSGTGDYGHGRGLMQIDDRTYGDWLAVADWTDPYTNIRKGVDIFLTQRQEISDAYGGNIDPASLDRLAIVAYNHGPAGALKNAEKGEWDTNTTGGNYSADVLDRQQKLLDKMAA